MSRQTALQNLCSRVFILQNRVGIGVEEHDHGPPLAQLPDDNVRVSIVSFQEQARGRLAYINRARKPADILKGFFYLHDLLRHYHIRRVVLFDQAAMQEFLVLQKQRIRIGTSDLRIAAIAKANGVKLLSRNLRDFRQVPGLDVEDWTV